MGKSQEVAAAEIGKHYWVATGSALYINNEELSSTHPFTSRQFLTLDYVDFPGCNAVILFSSFLSVVPLLILFNDGFTE